MNKEQYAQYLANTVIGQLGGQAFLDLTGATDFQYIEEARGALGMSVWPGPAKVTHIKITLNSKDLYDVFYGRLHSGGLFPMAQAHDLHWFELSANFERNTGLIITLFQ